MYAHLQSQYSGNPQHVEMLNKVIRDQTGADEIIFLGDIHADWSSNINAILTTNLLIAKLGLKPFESEESLRNFIFNKTIIRQKLITIIINKYSSQIVLHAF